MTMGPAVGMRSRLSVELLKFLLVGVVNTFVGLSVIYLAKWLLSLNDVAANALGYAVGLVVSFQLNGRWTFSHKGPHALALPRFLLGSGIAYGANLLTVMVLIRHFEVNSYLAQALGVPPYTLTSFLLTKFLVFNQKR